MGKFKDADLTIKTIKLFPDLKKKLRKGVISTIESPAKKFVDIRTRIKKAGGYAMGGEAAESVGKATVERSQRKIRRKEVDDMLDRVYGTGIKPKKKPKKPTKVKTPKIVKDLRAAGGIKSSDAIKAAIKAMKSKKR